jgi:hypothetical protein
MLQHGLFPSLKINLGYALTILLLLADCVTRPLPKIKRFQDLSRRAKGEKRGQKPSLRLGMPALNFRISAKTFVRNEALMPLA